MDTVILTISGLLITVTGFGVVTECVQGGLFLIGLGYSMGITAGLINRKGK